MDTEGSEFAIVNAVRVSIPAIVGELHGVRDWDAMPLLDRAHALGIDKPVSWTCYAFTPPR